MFDRHNIYYHIANESKYSNTLYIVTNAYNEHKFN